MDIMKSGNFTCEQRKSLDLLKRSWRIKSKLRISRCLSGRTEYNIFKDTKLNPHYNKHYLIQ